MNLEKFADTVGQLYHELEGADGLLLICVSKDQHLEWHKDTDLKLVRKIIDAFITLEEAASAYQDDFVDWLEHEFGYLIKKLRKNEAQRKENKGRVH